jgi:hypothetical protein
LEKIDDVTMLKPQLVIGLMGGNDAPLGVSVDESIVNISKIAESVSQSESRLVWCSSTPAGEGSKKNLEYSAYAEALINFQPKNKFDFIDMFHVYQDFPIEKFFTFTSEENPMEGISEGEPDLQHPNQLGNAYIAKVILKEVFGIEFDPEQYISDTNAGKKFPEY